MRQKTIKITYWIVTIIFGLGMLFSGISELVGSKQGNEVILQLGYPLYINTILGIAKILGVIAIWQTKFKTIKEWAYAGFTFDIVGAGASFALNGDGLLSTLSVLPFLVVLIISYVLWKKVNKFN
ncbi:MAG: DoxX family protein [Nanoarchaeota archaeon]|nr:DoxX family protein [Nanoarchaeota archaeon]